ncbi:MAG: sensor histidine kinase, partial [Rubrivivax sp.]
YLRATLGASRSLSHPLSAEFERLDDYLQLMAIRMGDRLTYTLDLPPELRNLPVPPLLLQPLVENAIKHGLEPCEECGGIRVRASLAGGGLQLEVADSGVGMGAEAAEAVRSGGGFGLVHVRERLATAYGGRARFDMTQAQPHGTRIVLQLPIDDPIDVQAAVVPPLPAASLSNTTATAS